MLIETFQDSDAWSSAHEFTLSVYRESSNFPKAELFGLTSQIRRAASSVAANLAEGFGRHSPRELLRFTRIANGSLQEAKYFLVLARDLSYLAKDQFAPLWKQATRTGQLLGGLERSLKNRVRA